MKEVDKVAFIEIQNGKILSTKSKGKTVYYIPGGKRELEETDEQTLVREVLEELNVQILTTTIKYLGTFLAQSDGDKKGVMVKMTCYIAKFTGTLKASNEIEELRWLNSSDSKNISEVDKKIFQFLKKEGLLE